MSTGRPSKATCQALAGAIAAIALLAGCGGSRGEGASAKTISTVRTSSLSKAEFVKRAIANCKRVRNHAVGEYMSYLRRHHLTLRRSDIASHANELFDTVTAPTYEREIEGIEALGAPKGDERRVTEILNAIQRSIEAGRKEPVSYFYGESPFHPAHVVAATYGLGWCATG